MFTQWPFAQNAYDRARGKLVWASWSGSVLRSKVDGTGLEYLRNRVYDSQSGRFTQEDPIGLAGGMNLYGFAGGDPANFSDPFGLCPLDKPLCHWIKAALIAAGTDVGFVAGGGAGLAAGPAAVAASPAMAAAGAAVGGILGAVAGDVVDNVFFSRRSDGGSSGTGLRGGSQRDRDPDYIRLQKEFKPSREERTRIHEEITKQKQGRQNLDYDELREIFTDIVKRKP